jgi:hypothetical protein
METPTPAASEDAAGPANGVLHLVAGPFSGAVAGIWPGARLADYLCAPDARRQVWHAWLAGRTPCAPSARRDADALHRRLTGAKGRDLVAEAYGVVPAGALQALAKLGSAARPAPVYPALMRLLADGGIGAKTIRHARALPDAFVAALAELPPALRAPGLAEKLKSAAQASLLRWACDRAALNDGGNEVERAVTALLDRPPRNRVVFDEVMERIVARCDLGVAFPPAPWPGASQLRPVATPAELRHAARRFRNCLASYSRDVRVGRHYFYVWDDRAEPAVVELTAVGTLGWRVTDVKGRRNAAVSDATARAIAEAFAPVETIFAGWFDARLAWWAGPEPERHQDIDLGLFD